MLQLAPSPDVNRRARMWIDGTASSLRSGAYRVFTRKRVFLVKSSEKILRTGLHGAGNGNFAHINLRSGSARRPVCQ